MFEHIITYIAPHHCVRCNTQDTLLCGICQHETLDAYVPACALCRCPTRLSLLCPACQAKSPFDGLWACGQYQGALETLIKKYKFERARAADRILAAMLGSVIPVLPADTVVTFVPTAKTRVRQRGYDQVERVARALAADRQLACQPLLRRLHGKRQLGASRRQRIDQALSAFELVCRAEPRPYLVLDDVITTGATLFAAAKLLKTAGAQFVFGAAVAHEPLQK